MSVIGDLLFSEPVSGGRRDLSLTDMEQWVDLGLTSTSASGVSVTPSKAMKMSAVYASIRILAETVASLPLIVYEKLERGKQRAENHHLFSLLRDAPNAFMTAMEYREAVQGHIAGWGNAYSFIDYDGAGRVRGLFPLRPDRMHQIVQQEDGQFRYQYQLPNGRLQWYPAFQIWHLRGLGMDGRIGYSPISLMRQAIGLGLAAEEFGARFFGNDARPGIVLEHPGTLGDDAHKHLRDSFTTEHGTLAKSHRVGILEEGITLKEIGIPPEEAQFIMTRRFQLQEIARMYRIPPHMLADLERATFTNIEHQGIEFVVHTMQPWFVRWEQSIKQRLMLKRDRKKYFAEFLIDALLRGDTQMRYQAYSIGRQFGWMSANDIRAKENMNPIPGGDEYLVPLNLIPMNGARSVLTLPDDDDDRTVAMSLARMLKAPPATRGNRALLGRRRLIGAYRTLFEEMAGKIIRREVNDITAKAKKLLRQRNIPELSLWLDGFFERHREFIDRTMRPLFRSYGEAVAAEAADEVSADQLTDEQLDELARAYTEDFAAHHIGISASQIRSTLSEAKKAGDNLLEALDELFLHWEEVRPGEIADIESVRSNNSMALAMYGAAGVIALMWRAFGDSCPYCTRLDGMTVGIQDAFIGSGDQFQPEGAPTPLVPEFDVRHPPAHNGCDCMIMAG